MQIEEVYIVARMPSTYSTTYLPMSLEGHMCGRVPRLDGGSLTADALVLSLRMFHWLCHLRPSNSASFQLGNEHVAAFALLSRTH